ncbi:PREDICTED: protein FLX-like 4 isoform X3 [Tarenaya hassleriana]|uniref:protein FLX-like 4 isoform X3 n=1 Tax=Tarenaya hassleriana TaxID=28532 RepID=UPI00053C2737|nr:PREDICTED: protein FLX-like 4 isoform X3 [Tarenaya hassleriana]
MLLQRRQDIYEEKLSIVDKGFAGQVTKCLGMALTAEGERDMRRKQLSCYMSSSRDRLPAKHHGRSVQGTSTGVMRQQRASHPELLENKIASQAAEIDQLSVDNRKLAASHVVLRDDLITAEHEVQGLRAHIRGIETESDIQVRVTLEKISKMEAVVKNGENIRRELQLAHLEAQRLLREREELVSRVHSASEELKKRRSDASCLKELGDELESLKDEHLRLRERFEKGKGVNVEQVSELRAMEDDIIRAVKEIESLRSDILNNRAPIGNGDYSFV